MSKEENDTCRTPTHLTEYKLIIEVENKRRNSTYFALTRNSSPPKIHLDFTQAGRQNTFSDGGKHTDRTVHVDTPSAWIV